MADAKPDLSRLGELAAGLGLHQHLCFIYETQEEQLAAALPFLRSGLERGEKCLFVADENSGAAVLNALRRAGTDVDRHQRSGALILVNKPFVNSGRFDPDWCIGFLSKSIQGAGDGMLSGMRTWLGEMTWALTEATAPEILIEFEAKINHFVRDHDVRALCQYRRQHFSPELILGVIRTHPIVVFGGVICKNAYYVPPDELLKPNQAAREVERLLTNILVRQRSFDELRALAARLQSVREDERTMVAREIHDELGQALTAIKLEFTALLQDLPPDQEPVGRRSQTILKLLNEAVHSVRRIGTELRPAMLDDLGLVASIEWLAEEFGARTGTEVQVSLPDVLVLDRERATALFRILQETLTNVARHANATQVSVGLTDEDGSLLLEVRDNGKGISEEQLSDGTRALGILGMRERALLLGGELTIGGAPGTGTTVTVLIPRQVTE